MKWYKSVISEELKQELYVKDDAYSFREEKLGEGKLSNWVSADKVSYNLEVTPEELKKEYDTQLEIVRAKIVEIEEYFNSFKGKTIDSRTKYKFHELTIIKPFSIAVIPMEIKDDEDKEAFRDVLNFKMDKNTIYATDIYLESYICGIDSDPELEEAEYLINRIEFIGLKECKIQHRALCLAISNKIGKIFSGNSVFLEDFEALLEGDITMKGFVKKLDVTKNKKTSC